MARMLWTSASSSWTRVWWRRARSANRPLNSSSFILAADGDGSVPTCVCSVGSGTRRQARWAAHATLHRLGQVLPKMETVGDLDGGRGASADAVCVGAGSVSADDL